MINMNYTFKILLFFSLALCLPRIGHAQPPLSLFFASANATRWNAPPQMYMQKFGQPVPPKPLPLKRSPYQIQTNQWPLFCRLEWQWEKTTALPWKFRLGNLDYVNQLEGK